MKILFTLLITIVFLQTQEIKAQYVEQRHQHSVENSTIAPVPSLTGVYNNHLLYSNLFNEKLYLLNGENAPTEITATFGVVRDNFLFNDNKTDVDEFTIDGSGNLSIVKTLNLTKDFRDIAKDSEGNKSRIIKSSYLFSKNKFEKYWSICRRCAQQND